MKNLAHTKEGGLPRGQATDYLRTMITNILESANINPLHHIHPATKMSDIQARYRYKRLPVPEIRRGEISLVEALSIEADVEADPEVPAAQAMGNVAVDVANDQDGGDEVPNDGNVDDNGDPRDDGADDPPSPIQRESSNNSDCSLSDPIQGNVGPNLRDSVAPHLNNTLGILMAIDDMQDQQKKNDSDQSSSSIIIRRNTPVKRLRAKRGNGQSSGQVSSQTSSVPSFSGAG